MAASPLGVTLVLLLFPVLVYVFVFDRFPSLLRRILSTPISTSSLASALSLQPRRDPFEDDSRPAFSPSVVEQLQARTWLTRLLPVELALECLEMAEYWEARSELWDRGLIVARRSAPYIQSKQVPRRGRLKQIRISLRSRDQGLSSFPHDHGTYRNSSSFFEACLLRLTSTDELASPSMRSSSNPFTWSAMDDPSPPPIIAMEVAGSRCTLQYNIHGGKYYKNHTLLFPSPPTHDPHGLLPPELAELEPLLPDPRNVLFDLARSGDRVSVEAGARYDGWTNVVERGRIDLMIAWYGGMRDEEPLGEKEPSGGKARS